MQELRRLEPISAITSALGSIKAATDIAKLLIEANTRLEKAELKLELAGLVEALANAKLQIADVRQMLGSKDDTIARLQAALKLKGRIALKNSAYWLTNEADGSTEGPFCTHCYDSDKVMCRLLPDKDEPGVKCPECKSTFASKPLFDHLRPEVEQKRKKYIDMVNRQDEKRGFNLFD